MLPLAIGTVGFSLFTILNRRATTIEKWNAAIYLLVGMYAAGQWFKVAIVGPSFIRWHLSDLGFPVAIAVVILPPLWQLVGVAKSNRALAAEYTPTQANYYRSKLRRRAMPVAVALSYVWELLEGYAYSQNPKEMATSAAGNFDWIDMAAYTLGGGLGFFFAHKVVQLYGQLVDAEAEYERQLAEAERRRRQAASSASAQQRRNAENQRRGRKRRK